jgi:hypothetical protein
MNPEWHLRIAGALQIALALLHIVISRQLNWRDELARLSLVNRQIFHVHTLFICVVLVLIGTLSLLAPDALLEPTQLTRLVLLGIAGFWALRLYCQWFVFDRTLWRGRRFETVAHLLATLLWSYLTAVYASVWFSVH